MKTTYWWLLAVTFASGLAAQTVTNAPLVREAAPAPMVVPAPILAAPAPAPATHSPATKATTKKKTPAATKKKAPAKPKPTTPKHGTTSAATKAAAGAPKAGANPLTPGLATATSTVNVRGRASLTSEVVSKLTAGEVVTVIEPVTIAKPRKGEPAQWARIAFPTNAHAWVFSEFIEPTNKTVLSKKLNVRSGPGENYSVIGSLARGEAISEMLTKDKWIEIAPPTNAVAFVAASYLKQQPAEAPATPAVPATTVAAVTPPPTPPPTAVTPPPAAPTNTVTPTAVVQPPPPVVAAAANVTPVVTHVPPPPLPPTPVVTTNEIASTPAAPTVTPTNKPTATAAKSPKSAKPAKPTKPALPAPPVLEEGPFVKRVVQREGIVRGTWSIQAPSAVELVHPETGETLDYLYSPSPELNLKRYRGKRVLVTGEEGLDKRWKDTPVLIIQKIQVLD